MVLGSILFVVMALMLGAITGLLWSSYKSSQNQAVRSLFFAFVSIFIYSLILNLVSLLGSRGGALLSLAYNTSILAGFAAMYFGLRLPIFNICPRIEKNIKPISWLIILVVVFVMGIQIIDPRLPMVSPNGVVFWNANALAMWTTSIFVLAYTIVWSALAYFNAKALGDFGLRLKMYVLAVNIAVIGISAFFFFPSKSELQSFLSFAITVPAYLATIGVFLFSRRKKTRAA